MDSNESLLKKLDNDLTAGRGVSDTNRGILHRDKVKPIADDWTEPEPEVHHDDLIHKKRTRQTTRTVFIILLQDEEFVEDINQCHICK